MLEEDDSDVVVSTEDSEDVVDATLEVERLPASSGTVVTTKELKQMIGDPDFDPEAIEVGLSKKQVEDFRRVQSAALEISKQKHHSEIMANWALGYHIDQMMTILEATSEDSKLEDRAAIHCAKVFNLLEKQVTDLRRFAQKFPDQTDVERLIAKGPSWTLIRYLLRYDTDAQRQEALSWMVHEGRFINAGDLRRIEEKKAANKEVGISKTMSELTDEVMTAKKERIEKQDAEAAKESKSSSSATKEKSSGLDGASTAKLLKQADRLCSDITEVAAVLTMRISRLDEIDDEKVHNKIVNTLKDKLCAEFTSAKETLESLISQIESL